MALFQEESTESADPTVEAEKAVDATPMSAGDPVAAAAAVSVLYAWYKFYVRGDREAGIFVGLWAPTMLSAASYLQQRDLIRKFKQGVSSF